MSATSSGTSRAGSVNLVAQLSGPVRRFLRTEQASAGLLGAVTVLALAWANSPWGGSYEALWATEFSLRLGAAQITEDLRHWVNDGLMVVFFGSEINGEGNARPVVLAADGRVLLDPSLEDLMRTAGPTRT